MNRRLLITALSAIMLSLATASIAAARPPDGDWTFLRKDAFRHYACKAPDRSDKGAWTIRTASFINGREDAREHGIGVGASLARGSNDNVVVNRTTERWRGDYIRLTLRGARGDDRVWVQGAYYGPTDPWSDGTRVSVLTRCD